MSYYNCHIGDNNVQNCVEISHSDLVLSLFLAILKDTSTYLFCLFLTAAIIIYKCFQKPNKIVIEIRKEHDLSFSIKLSQNGDEISVSHVQPGIIFRSYNHHELQSEDEWENCDQNEARGVFNDDESQTEDDEDSEYNEESESQESSEGEEESESQESSEGEEESENDIVKDRKRYRESFTEISKNWLDELGAPL